MTEGHYCSIHNTVFFKKGRMRGYAHPIKDEKGNDTGEWCNEEDLEKVKNLEPKKPIPPPLQKDEEPLPKSKSQEIAEHVWWKELGEMIRAKDIDLSKPAGKGMRTAYYAQMLSVLDIKIENK